MKNQAKGQKQKKDAIDCQHYSSFDSFFPDQRDCYTRQEIVQMLEAMHGKYLGQVMVLEFERATLQERNEKWESEHGISLASLFEQELQKMTLEEMNTKLEKAYKEMEMLSITDPLTHLLNRRALIELADKEIQRVLRTRESIDYYVNNKKNPGRRASDRLYEFKSTRKLEDYIGVLAVAIIDIDSFKQVNDTYGHLIGDQVLTELGRLLCKKNVLRLTDVVGRFGGEEFLILFPDTSARNSCVPLGKLIETIRKHRIKTSDGQSLNITVSIGVSEYTGEDNNINDIIRRADEALYTAKKNGKDQIVCYGQG